MADLFISYKSEDRARVKPLVAALLAFAQLDRAVATRDPGLIELRIDPALDPLRRGPRFAAIEKRLGFPPV